MRALLIAEKKSLMDTIKRVYQAHRGELGMDIHFVAQSGHLLGLKQPDEINPAYKKWSLDNLPLDVNFRYKVLAGKTNLVKSIRQEVKSGNYDFIIHAGDPDQEGEILIRETLDHVGNTLPVKRYWSNDTTDDAVLHALRNLRDDREYDRLAEAGYVRQHEDYIYGMNLTECMTLKSGPLIKTGRVKAAIVRAVVDRDREIEEFVPSSTYQRAFTYTQDGTDYPFVDPSETFDTKEQMRASVRQVPTEAEVLSFKRERKKGKAPKLYKLSTLQAEAYQRFSIPPAVTLSVLEELYLKQLVSYPRTACEYISSNEDVIGIYRNISGMISAIRERGMQPRSAAEIKADTAYCNDQAIASEGHTGIIPTGKQPPAGLTEAEQKIYMLIIRRFAAICMPYKTMEAVSALAKDVNGFRYECKGVSDVDPSWEYVLNAAYQPKRFALSVREGDVLSPVAFNAKEIKKKCSAHFNDGTLITFLSSPPKPQDEETADIRYTIGTEATRAGIIEDCIKNNYFTKTKEGYQATDFAKAIIREYGDLDVFQIDTSAQWEARLDGVRKGETAAADLERAMTASLVDMVNDIKGRTVEKMDRSANKPVPAGAKEALCACPKCGTGKVMENAKGYGCSNWRSDPKCDFAIWKNSFGASITRTDAKNLIRGKVINKGTKKLALDSDFKIGYAGGRQQGYER